MSTRAELLPETESTWDGSEFETLFRSSTARNHFDPKTDGMMKELGLASFSHGWKDDVLRAHKSRLTVHLSRP